MRLVLCLGLALLCGCLHTYNLEVREFDDEHPEGKLVRLYSFESQRNGNNLYYLNREFYKDGTLKKEEVKFERDIAGPLGEIGDALSQTAGALGNKL